MLELSRTVRFCLNGPTGKTARGPDLQTPRSNTYAAWPAVRGLGRYYELVVRCRGEADPVTGYFLNIKHIDTAVREHVLPHLEAVLAGDTPAADVPMGGLMRTLADRLGGERKPLSGKLDAVTLRLTASATLTIHLAAMYRVTLRHAYEFSAAHRLHVPSMSPAENAATFGKCNNPAGHGHNYRVEVAVSAPIDEHGETLAFEDLDAVVDEHAIEALDHKHLNEDVPRFAELNPSVEHIVKVVWDLLAEPVAGLGAGVKLDEVTVYETGKTACTYRGDADKPAAR